MVIWRLEIARVHLDLLDKNVYKFLWVTEFPEFEYSEEQGRYVAMHHPFTMPMEERYSDSLKTNPEKVRARAYDIVLNGTELGGGSIRIHQDDVQETMFEALGFTKKKRTNSLASSSMHSSMVLPGHAGLAYGLDSFDSCLWRSRTASVTRHRLSKGKRCFLSYDRCAKCCR